MTLAAGTRFGPYEVMALVGVGGMGEVYRARDPSLKRDVALKVLPEDLVTDANRLARLQREAEVLASVNHANVAHIYGLERSDGRMALVMELIDGVTLAERIAQGALTPSEAVAVATQIAAAVEAAHEHAIVHRDLKPANIKLKPDGTVKVLDFGIAKPLGVRTSSGPQPPGLTTPAMTEAGMVLGTAEYMSPEQARGKPVDKRTDIWAFGCVLYEMLTGKAAFLGDEVTATLARVLEREPDFDLLPVGLAPAVRRTIELCLQKDVRARLHDIGDVRLALTGIFDMAAHGAVTVRRARQRLFAVATVALVLGGLIGATIAWNARPPVEPVVARFVFDLPQGQSLGSADRDLIALSPDGRYFAYSTTAGLYLRAMGETEPRLLVEAERMLTNPFFSPNSDWIGYWDASAGQLKKVRLSGGSSVTLADATNPRGASWGRDDAIVFGQQEGIFRVSANGGASELIIKAGASEFWDPQALPDGSILYAAFGSPRTIHVQSPGRDDDTRLFAGERAIYLPSGHVVVAEGTAAGALFVRSFDFATRTYGALVPTQEAAFRAQGKTHFAVSATGTLAFATSLPTVAGNTGLALGNLNGTLEPLDMPPSRYRGPRVSPDGTELAVEIIGANARSGIWIYDLAGARPARPLLGAGSNIRPLWTPDGKRLTYASNRDGTWGIFWQAADGTGVAEQLTKADDGVEHWPDSWSTDMRTLAFTRIVGNLDAVAMQDIWTVALDDHGRPTEPEPFVTGGGAAFSPNGKWIAYRNADDTLGPTNQIQVQPFPPTGEINTLTNQGGSYPMWSRDGRKLFYRRPAAGGSGSTAPTFGTVEVTATESFAWSNETTITIPGGIAFFGYRDYDFTPDSAHFVTAVVSDSETAARLQASVAIEIVANWSVLVKEGAPLP